MLSADENAWLLVLRDIRNVYPSSEIARMSSAALVNTAVSWARVLVSVPPDRRREVYQATVIGAKFPPSAPEILATWTTIREDENRRHNEAEWKRQDDRKRKALPQGKAGPGERAHQLFMQRGEAIVCECPPKNGYQWPARLNTSCTAWECQQNPRCSFYLLVENTVGAAKPKKASELRDSISREAPKAARMEQSPAFKAAREAGFDPDAMEPRQFVQWQQFYRWWSEKYVDNRGCIAAMTPELVEEQWPIFTGESANADTALPDAFTEQEACAIDLSGIWESWPDGTICAVQIFCDYECMPREHFDAAVYRHFASVTSGRIDDLRVEYLKHWPAPNMQGLRLLAAPALTGAE